MTIQKENCYKDELNEDEFASDHDPADEEENDGFHDVDLDNIPNEEKLIKVSDDIEKIEEDPNKIVHQIDENEDDKKEEEKKE